mmetsp:Transcript_48664/g.146691  ORF Transcript_48664/g.146691 Transcript_48664/m.146691 type:complete len:223 (+) Transcript_48664:430-1098(+)
MAPAPSGARLRGATSRLRERTTACASVTGRRSTSRRTLRSPPTSPPNQRGPACMTRSYPSPSPGRRKRASPSGAPLLLQQRQLLRPTPTKMSCHSWLYSATTPTSRRGGTVPRSDSPAGSNPHLPPLLSSSRGSASWSCSRSCSWPERCTTPTATSPTPGGARRASTTSWSTKCASAVGRWRGRSVPTQAGLSPPSRGRTSRPSSSGPGLRRGRRWLCRKSM